MDRCAYLVNSTPKYYPLVLLHFMLISRYAPLLAIDLWFATEEPDHPICKNIERNYGVKILPIPREEAGFLDSRRAALRGLAATGEYDYVLPMQEDFLLEGRPVIGALEAAIGMLKKGVASVRLMPSPGPQKKQSEMSAWWDLEEGYDTYGFTYQATLWRLDSCLAWYEALCERLEQVAPRATTRPRDRIDLEVRTNFAENADGQRFFWRFFEARGERHMAWVREGPWANAVYRSPWPYRPTAVVHGILQPWARELAEREGRPIGPL